MFEMISFSCVLRNMIDRNPWGDPNLIGPSKSEEFETNSEQESFKTLGGIRDKSKFLAQHCPTFPEYWT